MNNSLSGATPLRLADNEGVFNLRKIEGKCQLGVEELRS